MDCYDYKLSICIPTHNRADKLKMLLDSILLEYDDFKDLIQICISNNASIDNTREIINKYKKKIPITYYEFEMEIHGYRNWSNAVCNLATGEYAWIIGDDDLLVNNALHRVMDLLNRCPSDYYYLNHLYRSFIELQDILKKNCNLMYNLEECECNDNTEHYVQKWEEILNYEGKFQDHNMLYLGNHLFKRELWNYDAEIFDIADIPKTFEEKNLDIWYSWWSPQLENIARNMMGKSCYYYGVPCIVQGMGENVDEIFSVRFITFLPRWLKLFQDYSIDTNVWKQYLAHMDDLVLDRIYNLVRYKPDLLTDHSYCLQYIKDRSQDTNFVVKLLKKGINIASYTSKLAVNNYEQNLKQLFNEKDGLVVLWGTGDVANDYVNSLEIIKRNIDYIVDGNDIKHENKYELIPLTIKSPYSLIDKKVFCIIVSTIKFETEVINFIKEHLKYPLYVISSKGINLINGET